MCVCLVIGYCFFFFQAEDGIRDAQESRGLGDVYKRQLQVLGYPWQGICSSVEWELHLGKLRAMELTWLQDFPAGAQELPITRVKKIYISNSCLKMIT